MISQSDAARVLETALALGADFAELFFEDKDELNIQYSSRVTNLSQINIFGAGLYLLSGVCSVYVYTNDVRPEALMSLCRQGCELLAEKSSGAAFRAPRQIEAPEPNPVARYPFEVPFADKIALLTETDAAIRGAGSDVKSAALQYFDTDQRVIVANSEGVWAEDRRITSRIRMVPAVVSDTGAISYFTDFTRAQGFEAFAGGSHIDLAVQTIADMRETLHAPEAPGGYVPVMLAGGGCSGTFFHEACGHQLETNDALVNGGIFLGRLGETVAGEKVTLVDDGTLPHAYGSSRFDDEGMPRQKNTLIENGVLKSYLANRLGARRLRVPRNACGRRQGYTFAPAARMSNTYLAAGSDDVNEMLSTMPEGLYVTRIGGGSGGREFTLLAQKAYWVKNGAIDRLVKGAILLGRGDRTMLDIDRVGNRLDFEGGGAFCGGVSGLCNTTTSGAAMRVTGMVVGGKGGKE